MAKLPAVALAATPGRRRATLELAREIEAKGFAGAYCASFGDALGLCEALALTTERIAFGTAIANLYTRHVSEYAQTAALIHELSGGRFQFGVGISHAPVNDRLGGSTRACARRSSCRRRRPATRSRRSRSCSRRSRDGALIATAEWRDALRFPALRVSSYSCLRRAGGAEGGSRHTAIRVTRTPAPSRRRIPAVRA
jgi:hypothetical protein